MLSPVPLKRIFFNSGGQLVSVLAFYSFDPNSIPVEVDNFSINIVENIKIKKKGSWMTH